MIKTDYVIKKIRVAIYVRVSTQEQAKEGYSISEQTDRLKKFAEAHDWLVVNVYTDAGHSGADTNRPALQEMLADIREGKIDKVLVYKLDRLSRSQKDTLTLIENEFIPHGTDFESMSEKLDTSTPQGRLFLGILAAFAQLEREVIKERLSMGIQARIKEGKWRGTQAPFGYDYEPALDKLVINEYEAMIVKAIYEAFTDGQTIYQIKEKMLDTGHVFRNGKADMRNIRTLLKRKTYLGYQKHNEEWIKGLHDAIIDEDTFDKAQKIFAEKKRKYDESGAKIGVEATSTNLGGLIFCARCGARYAKYRSGTAKYGFHLNYCCYSRCKKVKYMIKDPNCKNKTYRTAVLDQMIFDEIRKLAIDPDYINQIKKERMDTDAAEKIHAIEGHIKQINAQLSRFMDLYGLGRYTIEELDEKTAPLQDQRTKLQKEKERLQHDADKMPEEEVRQLVESFDEVLAAGDLRDTRSIIEALIDRIDIDGDDIYIHWNFA